MNWKRGLLWMGLTTLGIAAFVGYVELISWADRVSDGGWLVALAIFAPVLIVCSFCLGAWMD